MADDHGLEWPSEEIPDPDLLYMRVHKHNIKNGEPGPVSFRDRVPPDGGRPGLSTEWCRYSTPEIALSHARVPSDNGIVKMIVGDVRDIPGLSVEHTPLPRVRGHADIFGPKEDIETRIRLTRACKWVIHPPAM